MDRLTEPQAKLASEWTGFACQRGHMAAKNLNRPDLEHELVSAATWGVMRAASKFDEKIAQFNTFVRKAIDVEISKVIANSAPIGSRRRRNPDKEVPKMVNLNPRFDAPCVDREPLIDLTEECEHALSCLNEARKSDIISNILLGETQESIASRTGRKRSTVAAGICHSFKKIRAALADE